MSVPWRWDERFAHLDDVWMAEFTEVLDFPNGRHVETILELSDLDFLDSDSSTCALFASWEKGRWDSGKRRVGNDERN